MTPNKESLWTLVRTAVHTWWSQRSTPPSSPAPPSSPSPLPSEKPSPLIGWRAWSAKIGDDGRYCLWSPRFETQWEGPTLNLGVVLADNNFLVVAFELGHGHPSVGLHAARDRETVTAYMMEFDYLKSSPFEPRELCHQYAVVGQVECFGSIAEHTDGWRAQAMTIQRLYIPVEDAKLRADLEARYQCDVEVTA